MGSHKIMGTEIASVKGHPTYHTGDIHKTTLCWSDFVSLFGVLKGATHSELVAWMSSPLVLMGSCVVEDQTQYCGLTFATISLAPILLL